MSVIPLRNQLWTVLMKMSEHDEFADAQYLLNLRFKQLRKAALKTFDTGDKVMVLNPDTGEEIIGIVTGKGRKYLYVSMGGREYDASPMVVKKVEGGEV